MPYQFFSRLHSTSERGFRESLFSPCHIFMGREGGIPLFSSRVDCGRTGAVPLAHTPPGQEQNLSDPTNCQLSEKDLCSQRGCVCCLWLLTMSVTG